MDLLPGPPRSPAHPFASPAPHRGARMITLLRRLLTELLGTGRLGVVSPAFAVASLDHGLASTSCRSSGSPRQPSYSGSATTLCGDGSIAHGYPSNVIMHAGW